MAEETHISINMQPTILATEIARVIGAAAPNTQDIREVQQQLLSRHVELGLANKVASEEVVESFFRCLVIDHLQRRFKLGLDDIPSCVNSSHTATRRVCGARSRHRHQSISDSDWKVGWRRFQHRDPEVNIFVPGRRSPKRADLYVAALGGILSLEFKYVGPNGLRDVSGCDRQMSRYIENHAAALLVVYFGSRDGESRGIGQLRSLIDPAVHVLEVCGPPIAPR